MAKSEPFPWAQYSSTARIPHPLLLPLFPCSEAVPMLFIRGRSLAFGGVMALVTPQGSPKGRKRESTLGIGISSVSVHIRGREKEVEGKVVAAVAAAVLLLSLMLYKDAAAFASAFVVGSVWRT